MDSVRKDLLRIKNFTFHMQRLENKEKDLREKIQRYKDELNSTYPHNDEKFEDEASYSLANFEGSEVMLESKRLQRFLNEYIRHNSEYSPFLRDPTQYDVMPPTTPLEQVATDMYKTLKLLEKTKSLINRDLPAALIDRIESSRIRDVAEYVRIVQADSSPLGMGEIAYHHWHALVRLKKQIEYLEAEISKADNNLKKNNDLLDNVRVEFARVWVDLNSKGHKIGTFHKKNL